MEFGGKLYDDFHASRVLPDFQQDSKLRTPTQLAASAIELADGTIITAQTSTLLEPSAALLLNAMKHLAGIDLEVKLIPQDMIVLLQPETQKQTSISVRKPSYSLFVSLCTM